MVRAVPDAFPQRGPPAPSTATGRGARRGAIGGRTTNGDGPAA